MWQAIAAIIQLVYLLLTKKFEKDEEAKKRKDELHAEAKEAIRSGDTSRIIGVIDRVRRS